MKNNIFIFEKKNNEQWGNIKINLIDQVHFAIREGNNFQVKISSIEKDKTPKQLRGIHRLIKVISSQLREWGNLEYNEDAVKQIIKYKTGYVKNIKGIIVVKSFKDAMLSELREIIDFTQAWGQSELGIENCYLTAQEEKCIYDYYK